MDQTQFIKFLAVFAELAAPILSLLRFFGPRPHLPQAFTATADGKSCLAGSLLICDGGGRPEAFTLKPSSKSGDTIFGAVFCFPSSHQRGTFTLCPDPASKNRGYLLQLSLETGSVAHVLAP